MVLTILRQLFFGTRFTPSHPASRPARFRPDVEGLEERWVPATRIVNPGESIQAAIDQARAGDTIKVKAGTYTQQVVLNKDRITLVAHGKVTIQAPNELMGDRSILRVTGDADDVVIKGFTVKATASSAGNIFAGIRVDNKSSATIRDNVITGLFQRANTPNEGIGILIGNNYNSGDRFDRGDAKVFDNVIDRYHAAGIVINGTHSSASVKHNTITGVGTTDVVSQYGVQVSAHASAKVTHNTIKHNDLNGDDVTSAGILVFDATDEVFIGHNDVINNDVGVTLFGAQNVAVTHNNVSHNNGDGISLASDDPSFPIFPNLSLPTTRHNQILHNAVRRNGIATNAPGIDNGIGLYNASNNDIKGNRVEHNAGNGILIFGGRDNDLRSNRSTSNGLAGIVLEQTVGNRITCDLVGWNDGDGITLIDADCNTIKLNAVVDNGGVSLSIDKDSTGNCIRGNLVAFNDGGNFARPGGVSGAVDTDSVLDDETA